VEAHPELKANIRVAKIYAPCNNWNSNYLCMAGPADDMKKYS
jgi:hypothetical protein